MGLNESEKHPMADKSENRNSDTITGSLTYLAKAISNLMELKKMRQVDLARMTGLQKSHISRIVGGGQKFIDREDFELISRALTNNPVQQAELVAAHLMDECFGPGSHLVEFAVNKQKVDAPAWFPDASYLSLKAQKALQFILGQGKENPLAVETFLVSTAEIMRGGK